jgi:hypothetical protein
VLTVVLETGLVACGRDTPEPANDTVAVLPPAEVPPPPAPPAAVSWNGWPVRRAGELLVVPASGSSLRAQLVHPQLTDSTLTPTTHYDRARLDGFEVELFSPAGLVGRARHAAPQGASSARGEGCTAWPTARVVPEAEPLTPWTVAVAAGRVEAIPLDSVSTLSPADSARLVAAVARVASTLPQDTASAFAGLPFVVRSVRRFTPVAGREAFVADVVRRVNQEATQQVEHIFLVAERVAGATRAPYTPAYVERSSGAEETLELRDVLAALRLGPGGPPVLVVARDYGDGTAYALVERGEDGRWRVVWSSAYAGC